MVLEDMRAIRGQDEFGAAASWPSMPAPEPEPQPSKRDQMLARQKSRRQQRLIIHGRNAEWRRRRLVVHRRHAHR